MPDTTRDLVAREMRLQQRVIDLKGELDRERQLAAGLTRMSERAGASQSPADLFAVLSEESLHTFGVELALVLRVDRSSSELVAECCAGAVADCEIDGLTACARAVGFPGCGVLFAPGIPSIAGREMGTALYASFTEDRSSNHAGYAVFACVSMEKKPFYPAFNTEHAGLYQSFCDHFASLYRLIVERARIETLLGATRRFVSQEMLLALGHSDISTVRLGEAHERRASIMFADIRGFTSICEYKGAVGTVAFLNKHLCRAGPAVRRHGGFVDKYIGDAIMALFLSTPLDAVLAALDIIENRGPEAAGDDPTTAVARDNRIDVGIGIHAGDVLICTVGEPDRLEATVVSDAVNTAARIEALTKKLGCSLLVTKDVADSLPPSLLRLSRPLGRFGLKGKRNAVDIFEVFAADPPALSEAKSATRERWLSALACYVRGETELAAGIIGEIADLCPADLPMQWWLGQTRETFAGHRRRTSDYDVMWLSEK